MQTTTTNNNATQQAANQQAAVSTKNSAVLTLEKVDANYKPQANETFLIQGRKHAQFPMRPYYHVVLRAPSGSFPDLPELATDAVTRNALARLWKAATLELLKDKAAPMDAGSKIQCALSQTDVIAYINNIGNRERSSISGEELDEFAASYAFQALALVHNWNTVQQSRVAVALRQYAAPAHRKTQADAGILLKRLEALPTLLTGDDNALDTDLMRVYHWLAAKLQRDMTSNEASLMDSI